MSASRSFFRLSDGRLDVARLHQDLEDGRAGACVVFEGRVRNHHEGQVVTRLDYEAYDKLATAEGERIIREALAKFDILEAVCVHRTGRLIVGECAVWIGVISAHRDAAFQACRYLIDEIKTRLPIWKKEHYEDGESAWMNCLRCAHAASPDKAVELPGDEAKPSSSHGIHADQTPCTAPDIQAVPPDGKTSEEEKEKDAQEAEWQVDLEHTPFRLSRFVLIDVNEAREHVPIPDLAVRNVPFSRFNPEHPSLPEPEPDRPWLLYCAKGVRSAHLVRELRKRGHTHVFSLAGGLAQQDLARFRKRELEEAHIFYVHP